MGSGNRVTFGVIRGLGIGVFFSRFPFACTLHLSFACWYLDIGFGKPYDKP